MFDEQVSAYIEALQQDNLYGAINRWNDLERTYPTGTEPVSSHWVVYNPRDDAIEHVPSLPLDRLVRTYNDKAVEHMRADTAQEAEEIGYYQDMIEDVLDQEFAYFGTVTKNFYEHDGDLYMLDENDAKKSAGEHRIQKIDTITDGLKLEDIVETHQLVKDFGDIEWHGMFRNAEQLASLARKLYQKDRVGDEDLLYDGESAYRYNRIEDVFTPVDPDMEGKINEDTEQSLFEELFDISDLKERLSNSE